MDPSPEQAWVPRKLDPVLEAVLHHRIRVGDEASATPPSDHATPGAFVASRAQGWGSSAIPSEAPAGITHSLHPPLAKNLGLLDQGDVRGRAGEDPVLRGGPAAWVGRVDGPQPMQLPLDVVKLRVPRQNGLARRRTGGYPGLTAFGTSSRSVRALGMVCRGSRLDGIDRHNGRLNGGCKVDRRATGALDSLVPKITGGLLPGRVDEPLNVAGKRGRRMKADSRRKHRRYRRRSRRRTSGSPLHPGNGLRPRPRVGILVQGLVVRVRIRFTAGHVGVRALPK